GATTTCLCPASGRTKSFVTSPASALRLILAAPFILGGGMNRDELKRTIQERAAEVESGVEGKTPSRFKVFSGADILTLPRPQWRVKGVLPQHGLAVMWGPSRAGKTFAAIDMVLAIAQEKPWFGWKTTRCDILYVCLESTWGIQGRLRAWVISQHRPLPQNVNFILEPFNLQDSGDIEDIIKIAPKSGILVIDTLNRASPGADENNPKDMSLLINAASKIHEGMQGLVLLVAHSGKDETRGIRGHSSLIAALDSSVEVGRDKEDVRFIRLDKVKEGEDGVKKCFRLKTVVVGEDEDGDNITSCVLEPTEDTTRPAKSAKQMKILERLTPMIIAEVAKKESEDVHFTKSKFAGIYNTKWKKDEGDEEASRPNITAAIDYAISESFLCLEMLPADNGKEAPHLTTKGAIPVPEKSEPELANSWLNGNHNYEVDI
ncbi:helicase RepA family protein, partial [Desulfovibrio sp. OttesenSCG-928-G15]|nr:helicase RepA family protein [Desulfovibrio sp. OttesenSCG-928-G15]